MSLNLAEALFILTSITAIDYYLWRPKMKNANETTKERTDRLLSMSKAELVLHAQDLTKQRDDLLATIENLHKVKGRYHTEQAFQNLMMVYESVQGGA